MKKFIAVVLSLILCFGLAVTATASAPSGHITGIRASLAGNAQTSFYDNVARPGEIMRFPLTANLFNWSDGTTGTATTRVTRSQLNRAGVEPRSSGTDSSLIKEMTIKEGTINNMNTAYLEVVLVDTPVTRSRNFRFTLHLTYNSTRVEASRAVIEGTIESQSVTASDRDDYVDISKGQILRPDQFIRNIDLDIGNGVIIRTRLFSDQTYHGVASAGILSTDEAVASKHSSLSTVIRMNVSSNLRVTNTNTIYFEGYRGLHVHDANGRYLGQASNDKLFPYSERYYLFRSRVDMGGGTASSSSSSSSAPPSSAPSSSAPPAAVGAAITRDAAITATNSAIQSARTSGVRTASVRFQNNGSISADVLRAMNQAGTNAGMTVQLLADTMTGTAVTGRLVVPTASAANLTGDIRLGVRVDSGSVSTTRTRFSNWFDNRVAVVSLDQKSSFGMSVRVAARVDLTGMNTSNLRFYSYDAAGNRYSAIQNPGYFIDTNGYLQFNTVSAGEIIISDGALRAR